MKTPTLATLILLTTACTTQTTHIYKPDGTKQCEPSNTSLADSTTILTNAGIEVLSSSCGTQTGMAVITVCGAPTLGIYLHEINARNVKKAQVHGYKEAKTLINQEHGTGYTATDCSQQ